MMMMTLLIFCTVLPAHDEAIKDRYKISTRDENYRQSTDLYTLHSNQQTNPDLIELPADALSR